MAIVEMEPVLSQLERPTIVHPPEALSHTYDKLLLVSLYFNANMHVSNTLVGDSYMPERMPYVYCHILMQIMEVK